MRTAIITSLGATVLLACAAAARWRAPPSQAHAAAVAEAAAAVEPIAVEGVAVRRGTLILASDASGLAAAWRDVVVPALASGQVTLVRVRDGDGVARGDPLLALDDGEQRIALRDARAALEQARLSLREQTLLDERIPDAAMRDERARLARVRSGVDAAEARVARAELDLARTVVRAPFAGRVASVDARAGAWIAAGQPLLRVVELDPIRVEVRVLEDDVTAVRVGDVGVVHIPALPEAAYEGRIETVDPVIDPDSRTARVTLRVPNPDGRILAGMYARARLPIARLNERLLVPRSAVLERDGRFLVFVLEGPAGSARARWRWVTPGRGDGAVVEIEDGFLGEGDVVLTAGHDALVDGLPVRLLADPAATAP